MKIVVGCSSMSCGDGGNADLLLIAPCTANTISKIACGIDDTPVTTFATTALGSQIPIIVVPAMHHSMYRHPAVIENISKLKTWGVEIVNPRIEEGKAKIADREEIVLRCERAVLGTVLSGKKVLITSGPCREPVDDIRILTTRSSGQMGRELALQAFRLGADVTVIHRDSFPCVNNIFVETADEMRCAIHLCFSERGADIYISAAAIDMGDIRHPRMVRPRHIKVLMQSVKSYDRWLPSLVPRLLIADLCPQSFLLHQPHYALRYNAPQRPINPLLYVDSHMRNHLLREIPVSAR